MRELTSRESKEVAGGTGGFLGQLAASLAAAASQQAKKAGGIRAALSQLTPQQLEQLVKLQGRTRNDASNFAQTAAQTLMTISGRR